MSIRTAHWKPNPKRVVVVAATFKSGWNTVKLDLNANHKLVATITSGGKTVRLTSGAKKVGDMMVTIVPGKWAWSATCSIRTPTVTFTAQQVRELGRAKWVLAHKIYGRVVLRCSRLPTAPERSHTTMWLALQMGFKGAPDRASGILVSRLQLFACAR